jgi:hypothetical protein
MEKSGQRGDSKGNDWARKKTNPSLLEEKGRKCQVEDLGQT